MHRWREPQAVPGRESLDPVAVPFAPVLDGERDRHTVGKPRVRGVNEPIPAATRLSTGLLRTSVEKALQTALPVRYSVSWSAARLPLAKG
jgi:hypothetical protein